MRVYGTIVIASLALLAAGCGGTWPEAYDRYDLGPAREVIEAGIQATGDLAAWRNAGPVEAWALLTSYDESGRASVSRQRQIIDLRRDRITAWANTPRGYWKAVVDGKGTCRLKKRGFECDDEFADRLGRELSTLLHHARGAMNLLGRGEHPLNVRDANIEGLDVVRVGVLDDDGQPWAYYFARTGNMLKFLTCGGDRPGEKGTFVAYEYAVVSGGLAFPRRIRVVRTGKHILSGGEPVLEVEFTDVEIRRRRVPPEVDLRGGDGG